MTKTKEIFRHPLAESYLALSKQMSRYCKVDCPAPRALQEKYDKALYDYREYLDLIGCKMPEAVYYFDCKDKSTWKYDSVVIENSPNSNRKRFKHDIINTKWMIKHKSALHLNSD
jgi:hypothetical protein